jgi:hypothetical protein
VGEYSRYQYAKRQPHYYFLIFSWYTTLLVLVQLLLMLQHYWYCCWWYWYRSTVTAPLKVQVELNWRPTVSRPVCLSVGYPPGTSDQFFFLLEIFFRQLRVCYFVANSPTRGRVCNLLQNCFWALPEQTLLGRSPSELTAIFYYLIWDSPNLVGQVPVFISPRNRVAQLLFYKQLYTYFTQFAECTSTDCK